MIAKKIFWGVAQCNLQSGSDKPAILFLEDRWQCSGGTTNLSFPEQQITQYGESSFFNKMVSVYQTTQCHIPEDYKRLTYMTMRTMNLKFQSTENFKTFDIRIQNSGKISQHKIPQCLQHYFNNKLMCLNVIFLHVVASRHRFWCINHWKLRSPFWPPVCWYIIPYKPTLP